MSTNSAIGVVVNGKIKSVYCHWDGYPTFVGKLLVENYDQAKATLLIAEGSISSLAAEIGVQHDFDAGRGVDAEKFKNMTTFYRRDRGDDMWDVTISADAEEFLDSYGGEYWYILGTDGVWYVSEGDMKWKRVDSVLKGSV